MYVPGPAGREEHFRGGGESTVAGIADWRRSSYVGAVEYGEGNAEGIDDVDGEVGTTREGGSGSNRRPGSQRIEGTSRSGGEDDGCRFGFLSSGSHGRLLREGWHCESKSPSGYVIWREHLCG